MAGDGNGAATDAPDPGTCEVDAGPGFLRRLTKLEYRNTLIALFGSAEVPEDDPLSGNSEGEAYSTRASGLWVRDLSAQAISTHADAIAEWAVANRPSTITACAEVSPACAEQTVRDFGRRAFRMPLSDTLVERYSALFLAGASFDDALATMVSTMIQSPYFLYRRELGTVSSGNSVLSPHELGSALAYFLTSAPPDAELTSVIDAGTLMDEPVWNAQVARLLDLPATKDNIVRFAVEWLSLDLVHTRTKNESGVEVTDSLRASMMGEVEALVRSVYDGGGGFSDLLDGDVVYLNAELAAHYGMSGATGADHVAVPAGDRIGGLLGTGAYLLGHSTVDSSSPTGRGKYIREKLLCLEVPPPPPSVDTNLPAPTGPMTTRERFEIHQSSPVCAGCHESIDNYGFGLEAYDGLGRYRTNENGLPIDATGITVGLETGEVPYDGPHELASILATNDQVERCFNQNLAEYLFGTPDWDESCSVDKVVSETNQGQGSLKEALRAMLALPHVRSRKPQVAN